MSTVMSYTILACGVILSAVIVSFAYRIWRADRMEGRKSAARVGNSMFVAIKGFARTIDDWLPDARVKGGMVYNKRAKRLEISGRLSDDSLDRVFRR